MSDTAADTDEFTDIVEGIVPDVHRVCLVCNPGPTVEGTRAICGVKLLGLKPLPGAAVCDDCETVWAEHIINHMIGN